MARRTLSLVPVVIGLALGCSSSSSSTGAPADGALDDATSDEGVQQDSGSNTDDTGGAPTDANVDDSGSSADTSTPPDAGPAAKYQFVGRFDFSTGALTPKFAWPASAVVGRFTGTGVSVKLKDGGTNYWKVIVDGTPQAKNLATTSATDTYVLASGLADGTHDVMLYKLTETYVGDVQFEDFVPTGGAIVPVARDPSKHVIEIIGDSISCGYGDLCTPGNPPMSGFTADKEDEYLSYGAIAARTLGAYQVTTAWSGKGVFENYGGDKTELMPVLWPRTLASDPTSKWGFTDWIPDAVVVNLGTNDFSTGDPGSGYQDAYLAFLKQIRGKYPKATIFCAVGPMLGDPAYTQAGQYIQNAIAAMKPDTNLAFVELGTQDAPYGCDYHPSLATHASVGAKLAAAIKTKTGW